MAVALALTTRTNGTHVSDGQVEGQAEGQVALSLCSPLLVSAYSQRHCTELVDTERAQLAMFVRLFQEVYSNVERGRAFRVTDGRAEGVYSVYYTAVCKTSSSYGARMFAQYMTPPPVWSKLPRVEQDVWTRATNNTRFLESLLS